jgi:hypothetical protein
VWLCVLATLPFTAPFAAFDISDLCGNNDSQQSAAPIASSKRVPAPNNDSDDLISARAVHRVYADRETLARVASFTAHTDVAAVIVGATRPIPSPSLRGGFARPTILRL